MKYHYLIQLKFLGYRYHGWIKQPDQKTIQGTVEKAIKYVLGHQVFKTLGASRTDAGVSAESYPMELFLEDPLPTDFLDNVNLHLPPDIHAAAVELTDSDFNIIKSPRMKEYLYLFSFGEKAHPFSAAVMANFPDRLDINLMIEAAPVFEGSHDFQNYTLKSAGDTVREVEISKIEKNEWLTANFFPKQSYLYRVQSRGFLRYQIRRMMGQLIRIGRGEISVNDLVVTLSTSSKNSDHLMAPAAGLHLKKIDFNN